MATFITKFIFDYFQVDLIIMLVRGRSIGDSAFHTVVVPKKSYQAKKIILMIISIQK